MKDVVTDPEKVERILRTAMVLFGRQGFLASKTDEIAQKARVSKGLIFHYFGSKIDLYVDTYHYTFEHLYHRMDKRVWTDANGLAEMVVRVTRYKIELQLTYPDEFRFLVQAYADLPHFPETLRNEINRQNVQLMQLSNSIFANVINKLPFRKGIQKQDVMALVSSVVDSGIAKAEKLMASGGDYKRVEDFQPTIDKIRRQLEIIEHGFLPAK
jgi:AcrR family transcriptional regulator